MTTYAVDGGHHAYRGTDTLIFGIVLAVFTFWLFAQSTLNIAPAIRDSLAITESLSNTAVSISALFQGSSLWSPVGPSTDAALSNVPQDKAGAALGVHKMASSLGAAFGVAVSAALFTGLATVGASFGLSDLFLGRTDNVDVRFAAAIALLFNVLMAIVAVVAIAVTVPRTDPRTIA